MRKTHQTQELSNYKKLKGFVQVLTKDELTITSRDKKEVWLLVLERRWIIKD